MTTTPTKLPRPRSSYSKDYLRNRDTILYYKETHREEIKAYMKEYMREWRKNPSHSLSHRNHVAVKHYLSGNRPTALSAVRMLGCTVEEFAKLQGMALTEFQVVVKQNQMDHIIGTRWLSNNRRKLLPYLNRYYNLQFITETENTSKHAFVDVNDQNTKHILTLMELDYFMDKKRLTRNDHLRIATLQKVIAQSVKNKEAA